jgi:nucleotide-binding universal stress UspA family protein
MAFSRILVAYDGSEAARRALEHVADLAAGGADVTVLTVVATRLTSLGRTPVDPAALDAARQRLEEAYDELERRGIRVRAERAVGDPAERILEEAERRRADLVVAGSHGKPLSTQLLLGSVSTKVVRNARCAVLVVR